VANGIFTAYRNTTMGSGGAVPDWDTDTIKAMFVDHGVDTPVLATDDFINDIASGARIPALGSCPTIGTVTIGTVAAGVVDAADTVFTSLSGASAESLILFKDTGSEPTSNLLTYWDTATGLPLTPNGGNVTVTWNASGIIQF
jgi:hypothetical protein